MATLIWAQGAAEADSILDFDETDIVCRWGVTSDPPLTIDEIYSQLQGTDSQFVDPAFTWPEYK